MLLARLGLALALSALLVGCALNQPAAELGIRVTSQLMLADDPPLRQGLAHAGLYADGSAASQLTLHNVEALEFGNRLTLSVHWSHRPAGQFALRRDKTVLSGELPSTDHLSGFHNDQAVVQLRAQLLQQIGRQIGEEIQSYERHQN